tara:strand:- start:329 stop:1903 length:1575 start_codon:yes stop_codon:yes gene_type:complete
MESTLNVLDGIRDIEKAIGPNVPALEARAKTSISDKLAVGLVLEQTKGILNALSNDIKAKTTIVPEDVLTQTAKEVENMIVPGGISSLTPETMTASTVGSIGNQNLMRQRAALNKLGQPQGVTGLPTNLGNMATGARGGIVTFAKGDLVEEEPLGSITATGKRIPSAGYGFEPEGRDFAGADNFTVTGARAKDSPEYSSTRRRDAVEEVEVEEVEEAGEEGKEDPIVSAAIDINKKAKTSENVENLLETETPEAEKEPSEGDTPTGEFKKLLFGDGEDDEGLFGKLEKLNTKYDDDTAELLKRRKISFFGGPGVDPEMLSRISAAMADKKSFAGGVSAGGVAAAQFNKEQRELAQERLNKKRDAQADIVTREIDIAKEIYGESSTEARELRNYKLAIEKFGFEVVKAKASAEVSMQQVANQLLRITTDETIRKAANDIAKETNRISRIKARDANANSVYDALFNYAKVLNDQVATIRDQITQNYGQGQEAEEKRLKDLLESVQATSESVSKAIEKVAPSLGFEP